MRSRRDQVQAHAYVLGRLSSAMVHGEPDAFEPPMRRTTTGAFGGLMIGALGVAAFLIWALISPIKPAAASKAVSLTAWDLIVVPQTGARYIYTGAELLPVLNWSSARLLLGGSPKVQNVSASALASVPQGTPLGIVGAPDALPSAAAINQGDWLICARSSGAQPRVAVVIGASPPAEPVAPGQAVLVAADGSRYLLWHGERLRLDATWIAQALGLGQAPVTQVSQVWLDWVTGAWPVPICGRSRCPEWAARDPRLARSRPGSVKFSRYIMWGLPLRCISSNAAASRRSQLPRPRWN
jgi:type VII secretion protein EccB